MPLRLTSAPAQEPVSLTEAKDHLRLDSALDDAQVTRMIAAARRYVEQICWRGLITQTWELVLDSFQGEDTLELGSRNPSPGILSPGMPMSGGVARGARGFLPYIELPMGDLQSVTSVKYIDLSTGAQVTLPTTEYTVDTVSKPGRIRPEYMKVWPNPRMQWDAVRIVYVVGFGVDGTFVPEPIKQAMLILIAAMYEYRTPEVSERALAKVGFSVDALLGPYRLSRFG